MTNPPSPARESVVAHWSARLRQFMPGFFAQNPLLAQAAPHASVLLYGSTTLGIDDRFADLDVWFVVPQATFEDLRRESPQRFWQFHLGGKEGHFTLESREDFEDRVRRCQFPLIFELRASVTLADPDGWGRRVLARARQAIPEDVRRAWFRYHYTEMRGEHRACDSPIERNDPVALLPALAQTLSEAMRATLVLDGRPYPYSKWLGWACRETPTGRLVMPLVEDVLDLLAGDALRRPGPEKGHPLSDKLRQIRRVLIEQARANRLDGPYLEQWWLHMHEASDAALRVTWPE